MTWQTRISFTTWLTKMISSSHWPQAWRFSPVGNGKGLCTFSSSTVSGNFCFAGGRTTRTRPTLACGAHPLVDMLNVVKPTNKRLARDSVRGWGFKFPCTILVALMSWTKMGKRSTTCSLECTMAQGILRVWNVQRQGLGEHPKPAIHDHLKTGQR